MRTGWHVHRVLIVTKSGSAAARSLGYEISAWLQKYFVRTIVMENPRENDPEGVELRKAASMIEPYTGLLLVLGGDGTLISVARKILGMAVPLLGLNLGQVGFLTELTPEDWQDKLLTLKVFSFSYSLHLALTYKIKRAKKTLHEGVLVNDLVITRGTLARLVDLALHVDGEKVVHLRADGLIVSTPMGTTGYSGSARGPLIHPDARCFCITPICPFLYDFHPLVLWRESVAEIEVLETSSDVYATIDGQDCLPLQVGDRVVVTRAQSAVPMVELKESSYFGKLRRKGFIRDPETEAEASRPKYNWPPLKPYSWKSFASGQEATKAASDTDTNSAGETGSAASAEAKPADADGAKSAASGVPVGETSDGQAGASGQESKDGSPIDGQDVVSGERTGPEQD